MAGGSGTRLWPASTSSFPKQFLPASDKMSFFSLALERALNISEKVIVIAGSFHIPHVVSDASKFSVSDKKRITVIEEPLAKNTAPAIACALAYTFFSGQKSNMIVLTSDHIIKPVNKFKSDAKLALSAVSDNRLVVFGIKPFRPETGYGYIEIKNNKKNIFNVAAFHEKPDSQTAKNYLKKGNYFWNSGMFAFNIDFMIEQYKSLSSNVYQYFENLKKPGKSDYQTSKNIKILNSWKGLKTAYNKSEKISFDYAIAEKCKNVKMIRASFDWLDIGNWEEYIKITQNKNSRVFYSDNEKCFVDSDIPVAIAGVDDLIVVIRNGKNGKPPCALITKNGQTHKVRDIVEKMKISGFDELL